MQSEFWRGVRQQFGMLRSWGETPPLMMLYVAPLVVTLYFFSFSGVVFWHSVLAMSAGEQDNSYLTYTLPLGNLVVITL